LPDNWHPYSKLRICPFFLNMFSCTHRTLSQHFRGLKMTNLIDQSTLLKDIMTTPVITVTLSYSVSRAIKLAAEKNITGFPVIDIDSKVIGVVSTLDIITQVMLGKIASQLGELPLTIKVEKDVIKLNQYTKVKDAAFTLIKERIGRVIVVDDNDKLCGIISRKDMINFFINMHGLKDNQPYR